MSPKTSETDAQLDGLTDLANSRQRKIIGTNDETCSPPKIELLILSCCAASEKLTAAFPKLIKRKNNLDMGDGELGWGTKNPVSMG
jgi:hypothetical protein